MPKRVLIPPSLQNRPFLVLTARAAGLGEGRLRSVDLPRPFHGIRGASTHPDPVIARALAYAIRMRDGQFFSHSTAAHLWGAPLPREFESPELLHVSTIAPMRPPHTRGIRGHELRVSTRDLVTRHGLPTADAASVWLQLASVLSMPDLVAVGDYLVGVPAVLDRHDIRPHLALDALTVQVHSYRGPGKRAALRAVALIRVGAESRRETLLRLLIGDAGLPEPELNQNVFDANGAWIGRVDMIYRRWRVIVEYDGEQHRTSDGQYEHDMLRREQLAAAGWRVVHIRKSGLASAAGRAETVSRITRSLRTGGWRP